MSNLSTLVTGGIVNVIAREDMYTLDSSHANYKLTMQAIRDDDVDAFLDSLDIRKAINGFVKGRITIDNDVVKFDGVEVHQVIATRITDLMSQGFLDAAGMLNFLDNVMANPSYNSRAQLYTFLEHKELPITSDGCFLAYKAISREMKSKHTDVDGTRLDNSIGKVVKMDRHLIDDNPGSHCSRGLHVGALAYSGPGGAYHGYDDVCIIVKVNPRDVVSVPNDHSCQKVRCCEYTVKEIYSNPLNLAQYDDDKEVYAQDADLDWDSDFSEVDEVEVDDNVEFNYVKANDDEVFHSLLVTETDSLHVYGILNVLDDNFRLDEIQHRTFVKARISNLRWQ